MYDSIPSLTMVSKFVFVPYVGLFPLPNGRFMAFEWGCKPDHLYTNWDDPPSSPNLFPALCDPPTGVAHQVNALRHGLQPTEKTRET